MKTRCMGNMDPGAWTGFDCRLDAGHGGRCMPYQPPTVDEWRDAQATIAELRGALATVTALAEDEGRDIDADVIAGVRGGR